MTPVRHARGAAPVGLDLAADAIDDVIKRIEQEMSELLPVEFAFAGVDPADVVRRGESAPNLSLHYGRAHEVIWKT